MGGNDKMNEIEFLFIGWVKEGEHHDKVWTAFRVGDIHYAGWGRRGKSLRFKKHDSYWSLMRVLDKKEKTYKPVDEFQMFALFPHFQEDVEKYLGFAILSNHVM